MRLLNRHRHEQRDGRLTRIAFSQAEITADLQYPAAHRQSAPAQRTPRSAGR
jgi:hypothetical protein